MDLETQDPRPPTIDLGAYVLRPLRPEDALAWYTYLAGPEVTHLTSYALASIEDVQRLIDASVSGYGARRSCRWALVRRDSNRLIGTCGFYTWDAQQAIAELGYDLARDHWGQGIMTRAVDAAVRCGFDQFALHRIQATVMVGNLASVRVLEKCGFVREGTLRAYKICRGQPRDFWLFTRLR